MQLNWTTTKIQQLNLLSPAEITEKMGDAFNKQVNIFEFRHLLADGQIRDVEVHSAPITIQHQTLLFSIIHDITERKQAENNFKFFKTLVESSDQAIAASDMLGNLVYINPAHERLFGYTFEEARNLNYRVHYPPESVDILDQIVAPALARGENWAGELKVFDRFGREFWLWESAGVIFNSDKMPQYGFGIMDDITKRKWAEEALRDSEAKFRSYIEQAPLGVFVTDTQGRYVDVNPAAELITGYTAEQLTSMSIPDLLVPESFEDDLKHFRALVDTGQSYVETAFRRANGSVGCWNVSATRIGPDRYLGFVEDITGRKEREERIALLGRMLDEAPTGITIHDTEGHFLFSNRQNMLLHGYESEEEFLAINLHQLDVPESEAMVAERMHKISEEGEARFEAVHFHKDGSTLNLEVMVKTIDWHGQKAVLSIATDITERKTAEAERERLQAQLLQLQKSESLGRMAGAIAHHFNNHLHAVMGNLEMAMDDLPLGVNSNENLVSALHATRKAADVSILMLTYLGQTPGKHEPIDLSRACCQSLSLVQTVIPKGVTLNIDFPDSGPVIRADEGQINQALTNLITNAWESISNNQGTIGLAIRTVDQVPTTKRFPINWQPQEIAYACLEVSDTGCGISIKEIEKIFDPFFTTKFTGRGMGLPVVMGIVKAHGGCITVDSEAGCGSIFRMYLPILTEKIPLPLEPEKPVAALVQKVEKGGTVLLIEDEAMIRNTAKIILIRFGYTVIEAQDGVEAVEIFRRRQNEICCVLSDLTMPRMGGWETLTELRKIQNDVRVILASGHNKDVVMAGDHPEQPQAFLYKPYSMSALKEALAKAMRA